MIEAIIGSAWPLELIDFQGKQVFSVNFMFWGQCMVNDECLPTQ